MLRGSKALFRLYSDGDSKVEGDRDSKIELSYRCYLIIELSCRCRVPEGC